MTAIATGTAPRFLDGMESDDYHAHHALGSSSLKTLATRTPAHFVWERENPKTSDAFDLGTVAHSLILEQDESGVAVLQVRDKRSKAWKEFDADTRAEGKIPLTGAEWDRVTAMRDSVMSHPIARNAFTGHVAERSVFWEKSGVPVKCRPDAWNRGVIVDLKTAVNADPRDFPKKAMDLGYHQSQALYRDGMEALTGDRPRFLFVIVEKEPPHLVSVVELDPDFEALGARLNDQALTIYRECTDTGTWPGYPTPATPLPAPRWADSLTEGILGND
ncbi:hypothetical protein GCM10023081_46930 [Arthrobacter ginkgonis]|uniref:Putative exodeoxyribonuclease 8 PDDEXK-like domain-containing protein n=1 Tax=Arthrobacter ginkgonis TaxID=1630594 RepID=A0ABP7DK64_9MICC